MRVLAIDTTSARGSVALVDGGEVRGEVRLVSEASHSKRLLKAVAFLLESLEIRVEQLEGYAVAVGPGSFTGLRIGLGTVQGLALAHARPCLGVSALEALAARLLGAGELRVPLMDAWRDEVYGAVYDAGGLREGPIVEAPQSLVARLPAGQAAFLGDGAIRYRRLIEAARPDAVFPERGLFLAGTIGRLAEPRLAAGEGSGPELLRPLYVREADAVRARR